MSPPAEWTEYKLHRLFNCLPEGGLDAMEEWTLRLWIVFANLEAEREAMMVK